MKIETCPVCGSPIEHIELTTLPPIPIKQCLACGWRWEGKQEAVEYVTFKDEAAIKVKKAIDLLSEKRNLTRKLQEGWKNAEYCPPEGTVGSAALFYNQHKKYADALDLAITALRFMPEAGEPLSLEQLKQMDGKPAYWLKDESWGIISVDSTGRWAGKPFFRGRKQEANFEYDIESRNMEVYAYPPAHIDRSKWEFCLWCKDLQYLPHEMCADVKMPGGSEIGASFCPSCGRPLTEEAWAELEKCIGGKL